MATELERLDELLTKQEAKVRRAFVRYVQFLKSDTILRIVIDFLENGDTAGALRTVESYVAQMADVIPRIQQEVGEDAAQTIAQAIPSLGLAISFDSTNPRAAELVRTQRLALIRQFSTSQFAAVQQAMERAVATGLGATGAARAFRDAIGLTDLQEAAVANYRRLLQVRSAEALERALRDRRFDDKVRRAIATDRPLTARQIDMMTNRYRARAIMARSETISRAEAHRAYSEARDEALEQMVERTGMDPDRIERIWRTIKDERRREHHATMEGQTRALRESFVDGHGNALRYPGDPAAPADTVIGCRCTLTFRVKPPA